MYKFNSKNDLAAFIASEVLTTSEVMEILNCSRQNIDDLIRRNKLIPIKKHKHTQLFFKEDILNRLK